MSQEPPTAPKDVADALEAMARRIRTEPASADALKITLPEAEPGDDDPGFGEIDVFSDATHVMVTAQTRNVDAGSVRVSVADGRLHIGLGDGALATQTALPLPAPVDEEHAYATFRNGVLDVVLPRRGAVEREGAR